MIKTFIIVLFFSFLTSQDIFAKDSVVVSITVIGFKNNEGVCRLLLYDNKKGFPESQKDAQLMRSEKIRGGKAVFAFKIKSGDYAIAILHDENANGKLDKTWFGRPTEGFGTSNNPKVGFSPPKFEESLISIDNIKNEITINLFYF